MGVGARSGFGSHCMLPSSTLGSIQAASAFGCLAKFVTLWWVWLLWCLSKEALGGCGSDPVWFLSVPAQQGFISIRPVPSLCSTLPADTGCCGHGVGAAKAPGSNLGGCLWPISCQEPSQTVEAWALGRQCNLLVEAALALSGWPAALPRVIHLLSGIWCTKETTLWVGFSSLGCAV